MRLFALSYWAFALLVTLLSARALAEDPAPQGLLGGIPLDLWTTAVALIIDDQYQCSGVLVGEKAVLTAGHCALDLDLSKTVVFVGGGFYFVENGFYNSAFIPSGGVDDDNQQHDLGLLILKTRVVGMAPLPVAYSDPIRRGETFFVFGYGSNELSGEGFGARGLFDDGRGAMLVASRVKSGIIRSDHLVTGASVCIGDSGGPATQMFGNHVGVVGVTTYTTNGDFFGACTLGIGLSGIVDLQSRTSQEFLGNFAEVQRMSGPLAVFETAVRGIRDRFGVKLTEAQQSFDLAVVKSGAAQTRKELKQARKITKDKTRRHRLDVADRFLSRISKSDNFFEAIGHAAGAFLSLDQAVALGLN